jgi:hypothetical protein
MAAEISLKFLSGNSHPDFASALSQFSLVKNDQG